MPQFDQITFLNQIFWLFIFFFLFYFIIVYFFLPKLLNILKYRKKILAMKLSKNAQYRLGNKLNQQFFNNIYSLTTLLVLKLKTIYLFTLNEKIRIIPIFNNLNYNNDFFKVLIFKKILQK